MATFEIDALYFLYLAIENLRHDASVADTPLRDYFKDEWPANKERLEGLGKIFGKTKPYYDKLVQADVDNVDVKNPAFIQYRKRLTRIAKNISFLHKCFHILISNTDLRNRVITNTMMSGARMTYKRVKFDMKEAQTYSDKMMIKKGNERVPEKKDKPYG